MMEDINEMNCEPVNGNVSNEVMDVGAGEQNGEEKPAVESQSSISSASATEEINIASFYDEFIAFVDWSKKIQEINRVNLATLNSNVKLVNLKCDKILSCGRAKRYNSAILPLLQSSNEINREFYPDRAKEELGANCQINVKHISLNKVRPRLSPVKRKESTEDDEGENTNNGRRTSKRIRCMETIETDQDLEENKENSTDAQDEASIVEINLITFRIESKDFSIMKYENKYSFEEVVAEFNRLGFEAKRIYNKAKKLNILTPFYGPEIKVMIRQMEEHCMVFIGKHDSMIRVKLEERFDIARQMLNFDEETEDCEEGGINEEENETMTHECLESDLEIIQCFCKLYLQRSPDKDFYNEAKRLCTRSIILTKLARKNNYEVSRVEKVMDEVFEKVSEHYESFAPSRELKYNLLMQNKRYKTKVKRLNFYDRFLGSKKLKMPMTPPTPPVPVKLQLLPQLNIKKVQIEKKENQKVDKNEVSCGGGATNIEVFLARYNNLYKKFELFLNDEDIKSGRKGKDVGKGLVMKRQTCGQLIKDAKAYERDNWRDEDQVQSVRMVIAGTKKISGIVADNEKWFRNTPFLYYEEADSDWLKRTKELRNECLVYQKKELKTLFLNFLKSEPQNNDLYEKAVQFGSELVRLNRRSLEHTSEVADDIYKLTLRLYRNLCEFYEARASRGEILRNVHAQNKKGDTRRKILHFYDNDAKIEQLSAEVFFQNKYGSHSTTPKPQDETETMKLIKSPNTESTKAATSDIRSYFIKKPTSSTQSIDNLNDAKISNIKGDWRESDRGSQSESEAESNHSEYKASEAESNEDETEEEEEEEGVSENQTSEKETSAESEDSNKDESSSEDDQVDDEEELQDKKCTVILSGLSRHHTPVYMRSFLEMKRIAVIKCHVLPGPKSAAHSISVTVSAIHKTIINKLWGKTFKLTFYIH